MTKMKKIIAVGLAGIMAVSFAACSGAKSEPAKTGYAVYSEIKDDEYAQDAEKQLEINSVAAAVLVDKDGKLIDVKIDEAQIKPNLADNAGDVKDLRTKLAKQGDYGMKETSAKIGAIENGGEWFEQVAAFQEWAKGKTAEEIKAAAGEDGKIADLASSCTIYSAGFTAVVAQAMENAAELGASSTDTLALSVAAEKSHYFSEENVQYDIDYSIVTTDAEGKITSCVIDASQAKCSVADGKFTVAKGAYQTKKELKEQYGMKETSAQIGAIENGGEWYEQAAAFEAWTIGKTADEIKAGLNDEGKIADLASSCTITAASFANNTAAAATK